MRYIHAHKVTSIDHKMVINEQHRQKWGKFCDLPQMILGVHIDTSQNKGLIFRDSNISSEEAKLLRCHLVQKISVLGNIFENHIGTMTFL